MTRSGLLPTVAVAIPTYRREQVLVDTLNQVLEQQPPPNEIIVVDQTPVHEPGTEAFLRRTAATGRLIWLRQETPNLPQARNRALGVSSCDVVIFVDDDVVLPQGFVARHQSRYTDASVSAVAGRIEQEVWRERSAVAWPRAMDYRYFALNVAVPARGIARMGGCNHSVRRTALLDIGGYDENYIGWAYAEDSDAAVRLWKSGKCVVYDPEAVLTHLAIPAGGCRTADPALRRPEWMLSFPALYYAVRHLWPTLYFWREVAVWRVRQFVLRRATVTRPWKLPWAVASYSYALARAVVAAKRQVPTWQRDAAALAGMPSPESQARADSVPRR